MSGSTTSNLTTSSGSGTIASEQAASLAQYQEEEAQEIAFNMQMQTLQSQGKEADKASGATVGG
ncbi:MAG: hypothetical protein ACRYG8_47250 [Janthinobacterium lividum]